MCFGTGGRSSSSRTQWTSRRLTAASTTSTSVGTGLAIGVSPAAGPGPRQPVDVGVLRGPKDRDPFEQLRRQRDRRLVGGRHEGTPVGEERRSAQPPVARDRHSDRGRSAKVWLLAHRRPYRSRRRGARGPWRCPSIDAASDDARRTGASCPRTNGRADGATQLTCASCRTGGLVVGGWRLRRGRSVIPCPAAVAWARWPRPVRCCSSPAAPAGRRWRRRRRSPRPTHRARRSPSRASPAEVTELGDDWVLPGRDYANSRVDLRLGASTPATVRDLEPAWEVELAGTLSTVPLIVGDTVYVQDGRGTVVAVDRDDGEVRWRTEPYGFNIGPFGVAVADGRLFAMSGSTGRRRPRRRARATELWAQGHRGHADDRRSTSSRRSSTASSSSAPCR